MLLQGERKKSRWGDEAPVPVPMIPQGVVMPHNNIHAVPGKRKWQSLHNPKSF